MDATEFCSSNISLGYFDSIPLSTGQTAFCYQMVAIRNTMFYPLAHLMLIVYLIVFSITISGQIKEDFKYFLLNLAIFILILCAYLGIYLLMFSGKFDPTNIWTIIYFRYVSDLFIFSCLPTTLNRVFCMYFPHYYERYITKKTIIGFIMFYDLSWILFDYGAHQFENIGYKIYLLFLGLMMTTIIICCILLLLKIRKEANLLNSSISAQTLADARRACLFCFLQALITFINFSVGVFGIQSQIVLERKEIGYRNEFWVDVYILIVSMLDIIFFVSCTMDGVITLVVLKSYRNVIVSLVRNMVKKAHSNVAVTPIMVRGSQQQYN